MIWICFHLPIVPKTQWICFQERIYSNDINSINSSHVETVVSLCYKNVDSHVNINIEFGDEQDQILMDGIAQKAELI